MTLPSTPSPPSPGVAARGTILIVGGEHLKPVEDWISVHLGGQRRIRSVRFSPEQAVGIANHPDTPLGDIFTSPRGRTDEPAILDDLTLAVIDFEGIPPESRKPLLDRLDKGNINRLWFAGPAGYVRWVGPKEPPVDQLPIWEVSTAPNSEHFRTWVEGRLQDRLRAEDSFGDVRGQLQGHVGPNSTVELRLDLLLNHACLLLDLWKDPNDLTQLKTPLNQQLQFLKCELLEQSRDSSPELADLPPWARVTFATAALAHATQLEHQGVPFTPPAAFYSRIADYLPVAPEVSNKGVGLRPGVLAAFLLVTFARAVAHRFSGPDAYQDCRPVGHVGVSEKGNQLLQLDVPWEAVFGPSQEAKFGLQAVLRDLEIVAERTRARKHHHPFPFGQTGLTLHFKRPAG